MNKNFNLFLKKKSIYQIIFYLLVFFVASFFFYFFIPNFFNYSPQIIEENFKRNHSINIKNISKINYKVFPTPRLAVFGSNLSLKENILRVEESEIEIILKPSRILNYKKLYYNKIIIKGGSTKIKTNNINQLINYFKQNKLKIFLRENNIILINNDKFLFQINDSKTAINPANNQKQLTIKGILLNHKIIFLLDGKLRDGNNIIIKIPKLDILSSNFLSNKDKFGFLRGSVNFKFLNNFFQFNFSKEQNIKIKEGFLRSGLINSLIAGNLSFKPYFSFDLNIQPSTLNIEKLILILQKKYFLEDLRKTEFINKIDGSLNFRNMFRGSVVFKNTKIFFQNFKVGKVNPIFFDANISQFGPKGKVQFNLNTSIQYKKKVARNLKMSGHVTPSNSKVTFSKIIFDEENFTEKKINNYEEKFKNEVIDGSLSNIFNEKKIKNFFKNFKL